MSRPLYRKFFRKISVTCNAILRDEKYYKRDDRTANPVEECVDTMADFCRLQPISARRLEAGR